VEWYPTDLVSETERASAKIAIVEKIPPESLLLTTYTRKAARQLQHRLQETLQQLHTFFPEVKQIDLTAMRVGTIHSICLELLQTIATSPFRHIHLLDEIERIFFVQTILNQVNFSPRAGSEHEPSLRYTSGSSKTGLISNALPQPHLIWEYSSI
jgi:superfamily I DNA/RNA helicase